MTGQSTPTDPLTALAANVPVEKIYEDALQSAAKELGIANSDLIKAGRLLTIPVQLLAIGQERFDRWRKKIQSAVPLERRIPILPSLGGPILESLQYAGDGELVTELMLNLLAASMDGTRVGDVHPAFTRMVRDLAPDEAMILYWLKKRDYPVIWTNELLHPPSPPGVPPWGERVMERNEFPVENLAQPEHFLMFMERLRLLGLASVHQVGNQETIFAPPGGPHRQTGVRSFGRAALTDLGKMFARACVPDSLPAD